MPLHLVGDVRCLICAGVKCKNFLLDVPSCAGVRDAVRGRYGWWS